MITEEKRKLFRDLYGSKEALKSRAGAELKDILRAIDCDKLREAGVIDCEDYVAQVIIRGMRASVATNKFLGDISYLSDTSYYKLARLLQSDVIKTYKDFRDAIPKSLGTYQKAPKTLLELGGLPWKIKFPLPDKKKRISRNGKNGGLAKPQQEPQADILTELLGEQKKAWESLVNEEIERLGKAVEEIKTGRVDEAGELSGRISELEIGIGKVFAELKSINERLRGTIRINL